MAPAIRVGYRRLMARKNGIAKSVIRASSAWGSAGIERFLLNTEIPVRLACLSRNGTPRICSVWYLYDDGAIWCATQRSAQLAKWLDRNESCAFEVARDAPPYRGVRGQGVATLSDTDGPEVLLKLIDRYLKCRDTAFAQWLIARNGQEVAIRIVPQWLTSWDYSSRMGS